MNSQQDFKLPSLSPFLKLYKAPDDQRSGEPVWTLHNPASNAYFRLNWFGFECVSRFAFHKTAQSLKQEVEKETTLRVDLSEIKELVEFLNASGLTVLADQKILSSGHKEQKLWQKLLQGYLYFTIPLCSPQNFLTRTLPMIRPLLSAQANYLVATVFLVSLVMTSQRADEFLHTFTGMLSLEGAIQIALTLCFVKIVHEMGHAFTAVKHGVPVPHMGLAFMVFYPVLYTETTGSWQLSSRKAAFEIGFAGIRAEFFLATIALLLWNFLPAGSVAQSLCFTVVAVSLVGSLLVNLNPLMRFDGYYMLSDLVGIENLQSRSCNFARWQVRRIFLGIKDRPPEEVDAKTEKFLTLFGSALLIYRFFLFSGIAFAVYHIFFKPLGLVLMLVELWVFIALPILSELKIWNTRRQEIFKIPRAKIMMFVFFLLFLFFVLPIHNQLNLPAVAHSAKYTDVYAPDSAIVMEMFVQEGDMVKKDDVLTVLQSSELEHRYALAEQELNKLETLKRRAQTDSALMSDRFSSIDEKIEEAQKKLSAIIEQKDRLVILAPFSGHIRDMGDALHVGRGVQSGELIFRLVDERTFMITAYLPESEVGRVEKGDKAVFTSDASPFSNSPLTVTTISPTNVDRLVWPELSSCYGGDVQSECGKAEGGGPIPVQSLYRVEFSPAGPLPESEKMVLRGQVRIHADYFSPFVRFFSMLVGGMLRESGLS
jgi:putative peptide zinc metalloprotease protein